MSLGNWDINKQKEVEFLDKLPAMNRLPKLAKSLDLCDFPDIITTCQLYMSVSFSTLKSKAHIFNTTCCLLLNILSHLPNDTLYAAIQV